MTEIFVVSKNIRASKGNDVSDKNQTEPDIDLGKEKVVHSFSIYELLSNEYEEQNSGDVKSSSISNSKHPSEKHDNHTLRNGRNKSGSMQENAVSSPKNLEKIVSPNKNTPDLSLDSERHLHEKKCRRRKKVFQSIIFNKSIDISWLKGILYTPGIIIVGFLHTISLSLLPAHDLLEFPEYWYELIFHGLWTTTSGWVLQCFRASYFLNITYIRKFRNVFVMCLVGDGTMVFFVIGTHYLWTSFCGYTYPIPLLGIIATYFFRVLYCVVEWFCFPKEWRSNATLRNQIKFFILYMLFTILSDITYNIVIAVIIKSSSKNQPFVSLLMPLTREIWLWVSSQLVKRCTNGDVDGGTIILKYIISTVHTITLCYIVTVVTNATSWVLMIVDFIINLSICLRIVWLNKRTLLTIEIQSHLLLDLALFELVEFQAPLSFILVFVSAYFGPNAELFGNISNSYWSYKAVMDIHQTLGDMMLFFLIDFSSTILCAFILWYSCKINLLKVFGVLQKEFGTSFCVLLGYTLLVVCQNIFLIISYYQKPQID